MFDLRGAERMSRGGDNKARKECLAVNKNLSALYKVIKDVRKGKGASFRDTYLT